MMGRASSTLRTLGPAGRCRMDAKLIATWNLISQSCWSFGSYAWLRSAIRHEGLPLFLETSPSLPHEKWLPLATSSRSLMTASGVPQWLRLSSIVCAVTKMILTIEEVTAKEPI